MPCFKFQLFVTFSFLSHQGKGLLSHVVGFPGDMSVCHTFTIWPDGDVHTLTEMCARTVAAHIPFEVVEQMMPPVPEQLQLLIAFWSFPENEEDIRLYSCLANGNADEFLRGENHYKHKSVHDPLQIGESLMLILMIIFSNGINFVQIWVEICDARIKKKEIMPLFKFPKQ